MWRRMRLEDWPLSEPSLDEDGMLRPTLIRWVDAKKYKELYCGYFC
jgi:hypothetical protein